MENYVKHISLAYKENVKQIKNLEETKRRFEKMIPKLENFRDKLSMDVMVSVQPNSSLAFMEGTAIHTNELLVMLGSKYYAKMSSKDTMQYCQRKADEISKQQNILLEEQKLLLERLSWLGTQNVNESEILELFDENEERLWRMKHAENIKKMKKQEAEERKKLQVQSADKYFKRLEELELEESMEDS